MGVEGDGVGEGGAGGGDGGGWRVGGCQRVGWKVGDAGECGVIVDQGDGDGGDGGGEVIGDEASENVPEGVRGVGLALLQRVGLNVGVEAGADLDVGGVGGGVDAQKVQQFQLVVRMVGAVGFGEQDGVDGGSRDGRVRVGDVEGGVGVRGVRVGGGGAGGGGGGGGARRGGGGGVVIEGGGGVDEELMTAGRGFEPGAHQTVLVETQVKIPTVGREEAREVARYEAAGDGAAGEGAGGRGVHGVGGQHACGLVGLQFPAQGLGGEEAAMGGGGPGVEQRVEPEG